MHMKASCLHDLRVERTVQKCNDAQIFNFWWPPSIISPFSSLYETQFNNCKKFTQATKADLQNVQLALRHLDTILSHGSV